MLHLFLWWNNSLLYGFTTVCLYTHIEGHLGGFYLLAIMNNASVNIHVQNFLYAHVFISLRFESKSGISGSCGNYV